MIGWIVGFTDGEGCFSVSIFKNSTTRLGWQVFPEFSVTQGEKSLPALHKFREFFKCGSLVRNARKDNHREDLHRYVVRSVADLQKHIIPFFHRHALRTAKQRDFLIFADLVARIARQEHLTQRGMISIAKRVATMNRRKPSNFLSSSETIRRTSC